MQRFFAAVAAVCVVIPVMAVASPAASLTNDDQATRYVTQLYEDFLDRAPSDAEARGWAGQIRSGASRQIVSAGFTNSDEYRLIRIDAAYQGVLGRAPDAGGRMSWLAAMRGGAITTDDIETEFYASQEYFLQHGGTNSTFVRALYSTLLHRDPTNSDVQFWSNIVRAYGRGQVVDQFWDATETISARITAMYESYLGRAPDPGGLASWVNIALSIGDSGLRSALTASEEYWQRCAAKDGAPDPASTDDPTPSPSASPAGPIDTGGTGPGLPPLAAADVRHDTTPAGTAYTVYADPVDEHGTVRWGMSDAAYQSGATLPTVLYLHGSRGGDDDFADLAAWADLRNWLLDHGWAWIEGTGGATRAEGEVNWGDQGARDAYLSYVAHVDDELPIGPLVILGRSMGGVAAPWICLLSPIADRCAGLILNSAVQTMTYGDPDATDPLLQPSTVYFESQIRKGYGYASGAALDQAVAPFDPYNLPPEAWDGAKVLQLVGDADTTVPSAVRGADPIRAKYAGHPAIDQISVRHNGDHSTAHGSYHDVAAMTAFLMQVVPSG